jgi:hypothetical protein
MVESRSQRDILTDTKTVYVGDDTGLIKKVKVTAKRTEETQTIEYDRVRAPIRKRINGEEVIIPRKNL